MVRVMLIVMVMLLPVGAGAAPLYHVRQPTQACIDRAALRSHRHAGCFEVFPRQRWERISSAGHGLLLMRVDSARAREPLLYFRRSSLVLARDTVRSVRTIVTTTQSDARPQAIDAAALEPFAEVTAPAVARAATIPRPVVATTRRLQPEDDHLPIVLLLWALIVSGAVLLVRLLLRRGQPATYTSRCVDRLRDAGWVTRTRFSAGKARPHVVAHHNGLVMSLQCHASPLPVDVAAVEGACRARKRQQSDVAAIVSDAPFTEAARQLAQRTGIMLLREEELASFEG